MVMKYKMNINDGWFDGGLNYIGCIASNAILPGDDIKNYIGCIGCYVTSLSKHITMTSEMCNLKIADTIEVFSRVKSMKKQALPSKDVHEKNPT